MELVSFTKKIYDYFSYRLYGKDIDWSQVNGQKSMNSIREFAAYFVEKYGSAASPGFIWFYVIFQFSRFELTNFKPTAHVNFITPSMIFGKGAIEKFGDRKTIDELTLRVPWLQKHKLSQQEFVRKHGLTFTTTMEKVDRAKVEAILQQYKDPIKRIVATTNQGMDLCIELSDLYNDKDESCSICPYKKECKDMLKNINPQLYNLRRYE